MKSTGFQPIHDIAIRVITAAYIHIQSKLHSTAHSWFSTPAVEKNENKLKKPYSH